MPTLAKTLNNKLKEGLSPRRRRFGFFPGLFSSQVEMECHHSGQNERTMPQGVLIPFETTELIESDFEITKEDWTPTKLQERTAEWFISNVKKSYALLGFVETESLIPLEDDEAQEVFNELHPPFAALGHKCPQKLTETCAACRIPMLEGLKFDEGSTREKLRLELLHAYVTYHDHARARWLEITGDFRRGLATMGDGEEHYRKNIHEIALEERATAAADAYGQQTAAATVEGMREIAESMKGNGDLTAVLAQMAQTQAQQGEILKQLIANQGTSVSTSTTDAKIDKRTREYKDAQRVAEGGNEDNG